MIVHATKPHGGNTRTYEVLGRPGFPAPTSPCEEYCLASERERRRYGLVVLEFLKAGRLFGNDSDACLAMSERQSDES